MVAAPPRVVYGSHDWPCVEEDYALKREQQLSQLAKRRACAHEAHGCQEIDERDLKSSWMLEGGRVKICATRLFRGRLHRGKCFM